MPGGRPTNWSVELQNKAWEYANGGWESQGDQFPSIVGLCRYIGQIERSVYRWRNDEDKEFSHILAKILNDQHYELINKGISGEFNSNITKLVLGKHGYHDKQDQTLSGPGGDPIKTDNTWTIHIAGE